MKSKLYRGFFDGRTVSVVELDSGKATGVMTSLPVHMTVVQESSSFAWGADGPAQRQLAAALIYDATGDARLAVALMRPFAGLVLSGLGRSDAWVITDTIVRAIASSISQKAVAA